MAGNDVELNSTDTNTLICYRNLEELAPCEGDLLVAAVPSHDGLSAVPEGAYQVAAGKQASIRGGVRKDLSYAFWKLADVGVGDQKTSFTLLQGYLEGPQELLEASVKEDDLLDEFCGTSEHNSS